MSHQPLLALALFAAVYSAGAVVHDPSSTLNTLPNGQPCTNTINGNTTASTEVGGSIVIGCNNVVSNVTNGTAPVKVMIVGSDNVVQNDVVYSVDTDFDGFGVIIGSTSDTTDTEVGGTPFTLFTDTGSGNVITGDVANHIGIYAANGNTVTANTVRQDIHINDATDNTLTGNVATYLYGSTTFGTVMANNVASGTDNSEGVGEGSHGVVSAFRAYNSTFRGNKAANVAVTSDDHVDVESNTADYNVVVSLANWDASGRNGAPAPATAVWDVAPVTGACGGPFTQETNSGDGVSCNVILPSGKRLTAGTMQLAGTSCVGTTKVVLSDNDNNNDELMASDRMLCPMHHRRSLLSPMMPPICACSYVEFYNEGAADMNISISVGCNNNQQQCSGTARYAIVGAKTTTVKHNSATKIQVYGATSDVVESNTVDYELFIGNGNEYGNSGGVSNVVMTNNSMGAVHMSGEHNIAAGPDDLISLNHVDSTFAVAHSNNLTITNNSGACVPCAASLSALR